MGVQGGFIGGIFNWCDRWCDRWCERREFTSRCRVFADGAELEASFDRGPQALVNAPPLPEETPPPADHDGDWLLADSCQLSVLTARSRCGMPEQLVADG